MNLAVASGARWRISTRRTGEVFAAGHAADDVELMLLGIPAGFTAPELEGWLRDVVGVARDTARQDGGDRPIPILLHHLLTGLLFSHSELWDRAGGPLSCSVAFARAGDAVGFGWVGDAEPQVRINGQPMAIDWVRVRDDAGREALAFAVDARHDVDIEVGWPRAHAAGSPGIELSAQWAPRAAPSVMAIPALASREPAAPQVLTQDAVASVTLPAPPEPLAYAAPVAAASAMPAPPEPLAYAAPAAAAPAVPVSVAPPAAPPLEIERLDAELSDLTAPASVEAPPVPHGADPNWTVVYDAGREAAEPAEPVAPKRRGWFGWLAGLFARREPRVASWVAEDEVSPQGAPQNADVHAVTPSAELEPAAFEPEPLVPDAPANFGAPAETGAEMIPPSPEPAELTRRAVDWRASQAAPAVGIVREAAEPPMRPTIARVAERLDAMSRPDAPVAAPFIEPRTPAPPVPASLMPPVAPVAPPPVASAAATEIELVSFGEPVPPAAAPAPAPDPFEDEFAPRVPRRRPPMRAAWPAPESVQERPLWQKPWAWVVLVLALFGGGWLVGNLQEDSMPHDQPSVVSRALRGLGFGGARYQLTIDSRPSGAWIAVEGKDLARRTPATIDLTPGEHQVTLSFADLGGATYAVKGARGDNLSLDAALWGSLSIIESDSSVPVTVAVDGHAVGFVPVTLDSLLPGAHDVRFSGPGLSSWGQAVTVHVGETAQLIARPMTSPATGMIDVRASQAGDEGSDSIEGAQVWVDGVKRGVTPLTMELPRGPHSLRVEYNGEVSGVQVIDLPGGNQRFAKFEFGTGIDHPTLLAISPPARIAIDRAAVISTALDPVNAADVREMWLHVETPDGTWRRYQMDMLKATGGVVGVAVYPPTLFDAQGHGRWYASALTNTGDEYFTEIQPVELDTPAALQSGAVPPRRH